MFWIRSTPNYQSWISPCQLPQLFLVWKKVDSFVFSVDLKVNILYNYWYKLKFLLDLLIPFAWLIRNLIWNKIHFFPKFLQHKTEANLEPAKSVLRPLCYAFSTGFFYDFPSWALWIAKKVLKESPTNHNDAYQCWKIST